MKVKKILIFLLFTSVIIFAQNKKLNIDFDYSLFYYDDSTGLMELYYSFPQNKMIKNSKNGRDIINGYLFVEITDKDDKREVFKKEWNFESILDTNKKDQSLVGLLRFELPVGEYDCIVKGTDPNQKLLLDSINFDVQVKELSTLRFSISDLQLATQINQYAQDQNSIFYKNTLDVIPNPSLVYGEASPILFFYCELYNLNRDIKSNYLKVEHLLYNSRNEYVYRKTKYLPRNNSSIVEIGAINISRMPSGVYNLTFAATDTVKNLTITSSRRLYIVNPAILDTTELASQSKDVFATELSILSEEELDNMFAVSKYIATQQEIDKWSRLNNEESKQKFLYDFWNARDDDASEPGNKFKSNYFERVEYARQNFSDILNKQGWKSDRGRIYITYGRPSEIERHPNETDTKPYEIWYYEEMEGKVMFVFADLGGFNDYRLIHSTKRGELYDDNWFQSIVTR